MGIVQVKHVCVGVTGSLMQYDVTELMLIPFCYELATCIRVLGLGHEQVVSAPIYEVVW